MEILEQYINKLTPEELRHALLFEVSDTEYKTASVGEFAKSANLMCYMVLRLMISFKTK